MNKSHESRYPLLRNGARWRHENQFGLGEGVVLALYILILGWTIHVHEPWSDEAQAFLIARDNSWWRLMTHCLHYEGTPGLWHSLIRLYVICGGTWTLFPWFSGLFAVAGVYVLLRWSPFPLLIRWLLPFTFFFQYQYAVIARSYVLFGLLVFLLCTVYVSSKPRPIVFALLAGLLANLSLQGFCVSAILGFAALIRHWRERRFNDQVGSPLYLIAPSLILASAMLFALYVALPAPDIGFYAARDQVTGSGPVHQILKHQLGEEPSTHFLRHWPQLPPWRSPYVPVRGFLTNPAEWLAWQSGARPQDGVLGSVPNLVLEGLLVALEELTFPISRYNLLGLVFFSVFLIWLGKRHQLWTILLWLSLVAMGAALWVADHHTGMLIVTLIAGAWIAGAQSKPSSRWIEHTLFALTLLVIAGQIYWSYSAILRDTQAPYDPGKATAQYLRTRPQNERRAGFHFSTTSIAPYFAQKPFFNTRTSYWLWSVNADPDPHMPDTIAEHPDVVVVGSETPGVKSMRDQWVPLNKVFLVPPDPLIQAIELYGYHETHRFCGERFSRMGSAFRDCDLIYEPITRGAHDQ